MRILLAGDFHGNTEHAIKVAKVAKRSEADVIVQLGDFGFTWKSDGPEGRLQKLHNVLKQFDQRLVWLDGNHEDFDNLSALGATPDDDEPTELTSRITYFPRGYVWDWDGVRFMAFGGAVSVDQMYRTEHISWWAEERITAGQVERALDRGEVDVLLTHDVPDCPNFLGEKLSRLDYKTDRDSSANRQALRAVMDSTKPILVAHGHYHYAYNDEMNGAAIIGLDRDTKGDKSWVLLDTEKINEQVGEVLGEVERRRFKREEERNRPIEPPDTDF